MTNNEIIDAILNLRLIANDNLHISSIGFKDSIKRDLSVEGSIMMLIEKLNQDYRLAYYLKYPSIQKYKSKAVLLANRAMAKFFDDNFEIINMMLGVKDKLAISEFIVLCLRANIMHYMIATDDIMVEDKYFTAHWKSIISKGAK